MNEKGIGTVGVVNFPIEQAGTIPLSHLINILTGISERVVLLTGNEGYNRFKDDRSITLHNVVHQEGKGVMGRILQYLLTQVRVAGMLLRNRDDVDSWVFFIGGEGLLLPMLAAKLRRKPVVLSLAGLVPEQLAGRKDPFMRAFDLLMKVNLTLADRVVLYSPNLVNLWDLQRWSRKISFAHEHYLDLDRFKLTTPLSQRQEIVAYIGRLTYEKGIMSFVKAIPEVSEWRDTVTFVIGGEGAAKGEALDFLEKHQLQERAELVGWVSHADLPSWLNRFRLLVLPSGTEGLPNIVLEAMSCGTPVLVTAVGSLPDMIRDRENGYVLKEGTPKAVAEGMLRALGDERLEQVATAGNEFVRKEFTLENAKELWARVLRSV